MAGKKRQEKKYDKDDNRGELRRPQRPKECLFCKESLPISYKEWEILARFVSDRGRIISRTRSGVCNKHQRRLATGIKRARHLALLPFVVKPQ